MIGTLQSLRFIFAVMIFLHHFAVNGTGLFEAGGTCGVSFFIILSGFVMSMGYENKIITSDFCYKIFIFKRLIRVYPLHLLCLLGFIILNIPYYNGSDYLKLLPNLFLLQSWIPLREYYFSGNALSWCLADMLFFYTVFPFIVLYIHKNKRCKLIWTAGIFLVLYGGVLAFLPETYTHAILYINPFFRLYDFVFGMMIYELYHRIIKMHISFMHLSFRMKSLIEILSIVLLVACLILFPLVPQRVTFSIFYWIPMFLLIMVFALFDQAGGIVSRMLKNTFLIKMGSVSFSFYMIHLLAFIVLDSCITKLGLNIIWYIKLPIYFVVVSACSLLIFKYYEKPIASYLKNRFLL